MDHVLLTTVNVFICVGESGEGEVSIDDNYWRYEDPLPPLPTFLSHVLRVESAVRDWPGQTRREEITHRTLRTLDTRDRTVNRALLTWTLYDNYIAYQHQN